MGGCPSGIRTALIVSLAGYLLAAGLGGGDRRTGLVAAAWTALSLPLAYLALSHGTEGAVVKYGQTFSALQFLLSTDRAHYAAGTELLIRYAVLHVSSLCVVALVQFPFFSWILKRQ
ncbi:MAG: hypothetical protein HY039_11135 [Nitrospirae bacterium]|nr:hypothetical protein [Nitrospirota bacterium]